MDLWLYRYVISVWLLPFEKGPNLNQLLMLFSLFQEAIEAFKEALKLKSDFIDAYKSLGQAYRSLS